MFDKSKRQINYLRFSITENCNLRCEYCMPKDTKNVAETLDTKEIEKIILAMSKIGITKVRFTGGDPLVRNDFKEILERVNNIDDITNKVITTNGIKLLENLETIKRTNVKSLNISLDTLDSEKFKKITCGGAFEKVFDGIKKALEIGIESVKLNVVVMKGINDSEIENFIELTKDLRIKVRFIELMPIGEGKNFEPFFNEDILRSLKEKYELKELERVNGDGPAKYYKIDGYEGMVGFISPMSDKFCDKCNRVRVTSKGYLKLCLHYKDGIDLKPYLTDETSVEELANIIKDAIYEKPEKHSMEENIDKNIDNSKMNEIGG